MERKMVKLDIHAYRILESMRDALINTGQGASMSDAVRAFKDIAESAGYRFEKNGKVKL